MRYRTPDQSPFGYAAPFEGVEDIKFTLRPDTRPALVIATGPAPASAPEFAPADFLRKVANGFGGPV